MKNFLGEWSSLYFETKEKENISILFVLSAFIYRPSTKKQKKSKMKTMYMDQILIHVIFIFFSLLLILFLTSTASNTSSVWTIKQKKTRQCEMTITIRLQNRYCFLLLLRLDLINYSNLNKKTKWTFLFVVYYSKSWMSCMTQDKRKTEMLVEYLWVMIVDTICQKMEFYLAVLFLKW